MTGPRLALESFLDRSAARRPPYRRLIGEFRSLLAKPPAWPPEVSPQGGGIPVLVIPAFLTNDGHTADLRAFLDRQGFRTFGWELGFNVGPTPRLLDGVAALFDRLQRDQGPLALIGISLGGLLARNLAYERPDQVRHVVTIASPFRLPTATTLGPLVRLCARGYGAGLQPARLLTPLPVPSTMLFTRYDGIVAPDSCWMPEPLGEIVELGGPHITLGSQPDARRAILRRLAPQ
jgi:pimeloyl-ACP methyl ester carboxylesterase